MKFFQYENMIRLQICIEIKGLIFVRLMAQKYFLTIHSSIWEREGEANPLSHKKMGGGDPRISGPSYKRSLIDY